MTIDKAWVGVSLPFGWWTCSWASGVPKSVGATRSLYSCWPSLLTSLDTDHFWTKCPEVGSFYPATWGVDSSSTISVRSGVQRLPEGKGRQGKSRWSCFISFAATFVRPKTITPSVNRRCTLPRVPRDSRGGPGATAFGQGNSTASSTTMLKLKGPKARVGS